MSFVDCDITSSSGRGVVATRGSHLLMHRCQVHDSAATGVYIGGDGSFGEAVGCTIVRNGKGGERVLRGHSGIFVDRAKFNIRESMINSNFLTGVSLVGEGAHSVIENTQIKGNATNPIDCSPGKVELKGKNDIAIPPASTI